MTSDPNPSERLAEIEARVEAATAGPWRDGLWGSFDPPGYTESGPGVFAELTCGTLIGRDEKQHEADVDLITHAREDIPWLLEQLREAPEREQLLRDCLDYFRGFDRERTDGRTSPIIPRLEAALTDSDCPQQSRQEAPGGESVGEAG